MVKKFRPGCKGVKNRDMFIIEEKRLHNGYTNEWNPNTNKKTNECLSCTIS